MGYRIKRSERVLVFDLELTCWEPNDGTKTPEIIEIGYAYLSMVDFTVSEPVSILVRPNGEVSEYCTNLTGITEKTARTARPFDEAAKRMVSKGTLMQPSAMFGDDFSILAETSEQYGVRCPLNSCTFDVGVLWRLMGQHERSPGLDAALAEAGIEFRGRRHSALWDAYNTARLLGVILGDGFTNLRSQRISTEVYNPLCEHQPASDHIPAVSEQ